MKIASFIQCNGQGHLSQFTGIVQHLGEKYEFLPPVLVTKNTKHLPPYVHTQSEYKNFVHLKGPVLQFNKSGILDVSKTITSNLSFKAIFGYIKSIIEGIKFVRENKPDLIINFYEPIGNIISLFFPTIPVINIGHQFILEESIYHTDGLNTKKYHLLNTLCSLKGIKICLSYYNFNSKCNNIICPPILKKEVLNLKETVEDQGFILIYLTTLSLLNQVKSGLISLDEIPPIKIYAPLEKDTVTTLHIKDKEIPVYGILNKQYYEDLRTCRGVINCGGFASTSEAMYLGKRLILRPTKNHTEQRLNSIDATIIYKTCIGTYKHVKNLYDLEDNRFGQPSEKQQQWFSETYDIIDHVIEHSIFK